MRAVGFGALQHRDVLQVCGHGFERLEQVDQHAAVGLHLLRVDPALNQARFLVHRRIDDVCHLAHLAEDLGAACGVGQIDRHEAHAVLAVRRAAGNGHYIPVRQAGKMSDCGIADQTRRSGNEHGVLCHTKPSLCIHRFGPSLAHPSRGRQG